MSQQRQGHKFKWNLYPLLHLLKKECHNFMLTSQPKYENLVEFLHIYIYEWVKTLQHLVIIIFRGWSHSRNWNVKILKQKYWSNHTNISLTYFMFIFFLGILLKLSSLESMNQDKTYKIFHKQFTQKMIWNNANNELQVYIAFINKNVNG